MKSFVVYIVIALLVAAVMCVNYRFGLKDDHVAEELLEDTIEDYTGFSIDLTPFTSEK